MYVQGETPIIKNEALKYILTEGRTPMEKNIAVIDAQGRTYETTWPKRARGLVKSGKARFVNENTICLTRSP